MSTAGASVLGIGFTLTIIYLLWSAIGGKKADANPFQAKGSRMGKCGVPPIAHNFVDIPIVVEEAYAYGKKHDEAQIESPEPAKEEEVV